MPNASRLDRLRHCRDPVRPHRRLDARQPAGRRPRGRGRRRARRAAAAPAAAAPSQPAPPLDEAGVKALETVAEQNPKDAAPRVQLGNLYFDAEHYTDAIKWYEAALRSIPTMPNVSTDLGVATTTPTSPIARSRSSSTRCRIDPKHTKTLLNMGIVKAFGKQDLAGAAAGVAAGRRRLRPNSPEGQAAKQGARRPPAARIPTTAPGTGGQ